MKRHAPCRPLARVLESDAQLAQWSARQREEAALTMHVRRTLPHTLGQRVHVTGLRNGVLEIAASGGAIAAALRQRAASLPMVLRAEGFDVSEVRVRVQVVSTAPDRERKAADRVLDVRAATPLFDLAERLPQGALRDALARWSRRARGR